MEFRSAALLYGHEEHHLDHLAVICCLMHIPLVVTQEEIAHLARTHYPGLDVVHTLSLEAPSFIAEHFDVIFCALPRLLFDEIFFFVQHLYRKKIHTIWCPHGNSDKGHASAFMEALHLETVALVYGPKMIDFLIAKKVFHQLKAHIVIGNLRHTFYIKHQQFYDEIAQREIQRKLKPALKTLLYAPTWQDREKSSSFFDATPILIETLPENCNLIIKLHPNLLHQGEGKTERLLMRYESHPHVLFLTSFPPVYPLLHLTDVYIGDMSSIGYDFLIFNKPMFFLNQNHRSASTDPGLYLFRCGIEVKPEEYPLFYTIMQKHLLSDTQQFASIRKQVYDHTFGKDKNWDTLRSEIASAFSVFPDL